jgi:HSP20 family protein
MTLVRFNNKPAVRGFSNLVDDFFNDFPALVNDEFSKVVGKRVAPVNIRENKDSYEMDVVAPGFEKNDFSINLENNLLTISAEKKNETKDENEKQIRREYQYQSFKRSFTLDEKIDAAGIDAKYLNGVLTLNLPKREEVKQSAKEIVIK